MVDLGAGAIGFHPTLGRTKRLLQSEDGVVSRQQKNDEAVEVLEEAVDGQPDNVWARLNLGVTLLKLDRASDAVTHRQRAVQLQSENQGAWLALGDACRLSSSLKDAEVGYAKAIALNPHNDFAESARAGSSKLAQQSFETKAVGAIRMNAAHYCLAVINYFTRLPKAEV